MATGDNIHTAIWVANKCGILQEDQRIIYAHQLEY